jgi:hypothetical protein
LGRTHDARAAALDRGRDDSAAGNWNLDGRQEHAAEGSLLVICRPSISQRKPSSRPLQGAALGSQDFAGLMSSRIEVIMS